MYAFFYILHHLSLFISSISFCIRLFSFACVSFFFSESDDGFEVVKMKIFKSKGMESLKGNEHKSKGRLLCAKESCHCTRPCYFQRRANTIWFFQQSQFDDKITNVEGIVFEPR